MLVSELNSALSALLLIPEMLGKSADSNGTLVALPANYSDNCTTAYNKIASQNFIPTLCKHVGNSAEPIKIPYGIMASGALDELLNTWEETYINRESTKPSEISNLVSSSYIFYCAIVCGVDTKQNSLPHPVSESLATMLLHCIEFCGHYEDFKTSILPIVMVAAILSAYMISQLDESPIMSDALNELVSVIHHITNNLKLEDCIPEICAVWFSDLEQRVFEYNLGRTK